MPASREKQAYLRGLRGGLPFAFVAGPFGLLFGVVAIESGLSIIEAVTFTFVVIAGAAQFAALQQMTDMAPTLIVIAIALAVNLRMAMYSATLAVHLGSLPLWKRALVAYVNFDQTFLASTLDYDRHPDDPPTAKFAFFMGSATPIVPIWVIATVVGTLGGQAIPDSFALDFALPITFLAMIGPSLRTLAHVVAALVSVIAALVFAVLPFGMGLLVAAGLAMVAGAQTELWVERRNAE